MQTYLVKVNYNFSQKTLVINTSDNHSLHKILSNMQIDSYDAYPIDTAFQGLVLSV